MGANYSARTSLKSKDDKKTAVSHPAYFPRIRAAVWLALPLLTGWALAESFDKAARREAWESFRASYEPDLSDSSRFLEPPETGRLAKPIRIAEGGRALAEIIVDLSDAVLIDNFFPDKASWSLPLRYARGHEAAAMRTAAFALRDGLKLLTGADFPVRASTPELEGPGGTGGGAPREEGPGGAGGGAPRPFAIYLGASFAKPHFPDDLAALASSRAHDGFAVRG